MLHYIFLGSLFVFSLAFYLAFHSVSGKRAQKFLWLLLLMTFLGATVTWLIASYFTGKGVDQVVIYHLRYGVAGAGLGEYSEIILVGALLIFLAGFLIFWIYRKWANSQKTAGKLAFFVGTLFLLFGIFLNLLSNQFIFDALEYHGESRNDFNDYYRPGWIKPLENQKPLNVVYIYAESLERTYFDEEKFPGLIKHLRGFQNRSLDFSNIKQTPYAGWTIAGMVSSQCGLPLYKVLPDEEVGGFMNRAVCLGDLLASQGYNLAFFGGADLDFAGKGDFYLEHAFNWIGGKIELENLLEDRSYQTSWGLYDDSLLEIVKERFVELAAKEQPFGLFTLTLDTHHPKGHPSASCKGLEYQDGENSILNAVACSDYLIADFIDFIRQSSYSDNTLIVLASDHLAMRNDALYILSNPEEDRRNLFLINHPQISAVATINEPGVTLDIGPTLLPFLGFEGDIGLGRDLIREKSILYELEDGIETIFDWEDHFTSFWLP